MVRGDCAQYAVGKSKPFVRCTGRSDKLSIFHQSTIATGDGLVKAFRAGVEVRYVEFVQFHPITFTVAILDVF